jgi:hypothetical protein
MIEEIPDEGATALLMGDVRECGLAPADSGLETAVSVKSSHSYLLRPGRGTLTQCPKQ